MANDNNHRNDRCYARSRGGCSPKITGEHFVSNVVLQLIGDGAIRAGGYPWLPAGQERIVGAASLNAKVLCDQHNPQLSTCDSTLGDLFEALDPLTSGADRVDGPTAVVDGPALERALLKVLCGALAAGQVGGVGKGFQPPPRWLALLFGDSPWPPGAGLYIQATEHVPFRGVALRPLLHPGRSAPGARRGEIGGMQLVARGLVLQLALLDGQAGGGEFASSVYRPGRITFGWADRRVYDVELGFAGGRAVAFSAHRLKIERNDPCPCESGKKYKSCHGRFPQTVWRPLAA